MNTWKLSVGGSDAYVMSPSAAGAKIYVRDQRLLPLGVIASELVSLATVPRSAKLHKAVFLNPVEAANARV